ncbi:MAG: CmcJ/NvfI family oxidoreductase [Pseudomonadota bacterium]
MLSMKSDAANHAGARDGVLNYMSRASESSLRRNGKVLTRRDLDGNDSVREGVELEPVVAPIIDARQLTGAAACTLHDHGFELVARDLGTDTPDYFSHANVVQLYYPDCVELVQEATGSAHVYAFDHNVRSAQGKNEQTRIDGGQHVQGPARMVHGDYTLTSAPQRLRDLARPPTTNDTMKPFLPDGESLIPPDVMQDFSAGSGRFAIINVWRNIAPEPVQTHPLALCDARSVGPDELVVFEIHYADRVGENYFAKPGSTHRWFCYPEMTRNEALLLKQWDSAGIFATSDGERGDGEIPGQPSTFSFHTAFQDPKAPDDAPARWSIEVRTVVLYP